MKRDWLLVAFLAVALGLGIIGLKLPAPAASGQTDRPMPVVIVDAGPYGADRRACPRFVWCARVTREGSLHITTGR